MASRIDKDILLKYADKAFLAVAVLFLAIVGILMVGQKPPAVRYETLVGEYDQAEKKQRVMFTGTDNFDKDVRTLLGLPEGDLSNAPKDEMDVYNLLVTTPPFAETFAREHVALAPSWADRPQWDPYFPAISPSANTFRQWLIPTKLVAPTNLVLLQDKGYQPSGKEKDKQFGTDLIYVSGQARLNLAQQTLWSREAAPGSTTIIATLPTDFEVQRRQKMSDDSWGDWQPRPTVRLEQVKNQAAVLRPVVAEAKTLDGESNKNHKKAYVELVDKYRAAMQTRGKDLLHPPFYKMAGKEWLSPYEVHKVSSSAATGEPPVEGGGLPPSATMAGPAAATGEQSDLWFTDPLASGDVGKTYQYRVRIRFFNPIFNGPTAQTMANERYLIEIPGAWSDPSDPITVAPLVRFYFTGKFNSGGVSRANIELHAWKHGCWYRKKGATFDLGDPITWSEKQDAYIPGGESGQQVKLGFQDRIVFDAGATVVDLGEGTTRYNGILKATERLLFWDNQSNRLEARLAWDDKNRAGQDQKKEDAETGVKGTLPVVAPPHPAPPMPGLRLPSSATRPAPTPSPAGTGMRR